MAAYWAGRRAEPSADSSVDRRVEPTADSKADLMVGSLVGHLAARLAFCSAATWGDSKADD